MDDDNSGSLSLEEFTKAIKDYKLGLDDNTIKLVFEGFDRDKEGTIDYDEFVRCVRGPMSTKRVRLVERAFAKLDKDGNGTIEAEDLKGVYNAKNHPDVKSGKKTEEEVLGDFLQTFEMHLNLGGGTCDHVITKEEFLEYYNNVSASIDDDRYFETMITNAWKLGPEPPGSSLRHHKQPSAAERTPYGTTEIPVEQPKKQKAAKQDSDEDTKESISRPKTAVVAKKKNDEKSETSEVSVDPEEKRLFDLLRDCLKKRGTRGIFGIQRMFKVFF